MKMRRKSSSAMPVPVSSISTFDHAQRQQPTTPARPSAPTRGSSTASSSSSTASSSSSTGGGFTPGTHVRHPKYGRGLVLRREGAGDSVKLLVSFPGFGQKKLVEKYAGLEKA